MYKICIEMYNASVSKYNKMCVCVCVRARAHACVRACVIQCAHISAGFILFCSMNVVFVISIIYSKCDYYNAFPNILAPTVLKINISCIILGFIYDFLSTLL